MEPYIRSGSISPTGMGKFEGRKGVAHCKVYGHSVVGCAKTTEPIEMPFVLWARMSPRNHGVQIPSWEGTILRGKAAR